MRPLKLTMTGFGPYRNRTEIDFGSPDQDGLYLITGNTGDGRNSFFDAITYALYGGAEGGEEEPAEAELVFEHGGEEYAVSRKTGEDYACLKKPDGNTVTGADAVNEEIRKLLGADRRQFCSIKLIAQSDFRRLLTADTEERQLLFRKLFGTDQYSSFTEALREKRREVTGERNDALRNIQLAFANVRCSFDDAIAARLEDIRNAPSASPDDLIDMLLSLIEYSEYKASAADDELEEVEKELSIINGRVAVMESDRDSLSRLDEARNSVAKLEDAISTAEFELELANAEKPAIEKMLRDASAMEGRLASYAGIDDLSAEIAEAERKVSEKAAGLKSLKEERKKARERAERARLSFNSAKYSDERLVRLRNDIEKTNNKIALLRSLDEELLKARDLKELLGREQEALDPLLRKAEELEAEYSMTHSRYLRNQAGILANILEEGEPCPVCGSREHPDPAIPDSRIMTAEDLAAAESAAKAARAEASEQAAQVKKIRGALNASEYGLRGITLKVLGTDDLDKAIETSERAMTGLESDRIAYELLEKELQEKIESGPDLGAPLHEAAAAHDRLNDLVMQADRELSALRAELSAIYRRRDDSAMYLKYGSRSEAERQVSEIRNAAAKKQQMIDDAEKALTQAREAALSNAVLIRELEKAAEGITPMDQIEVYQSRTDAEAKKNRLLGLKDAVSGDLVSVRTALDSIRKEKEHLEEIKKKQEKIDPLVMTAEGSAGGREGMSMESHVQNARFESMLGKANERLQELSDGQYEFMRTPGQAYDMPYLGLNLRVADHYSGSETPVSMLRAPESFLASLALALGLSDEAQSSAGGIRADALFLDEGFGSLDAETIEMAVRKLSELSEDDLLIGIISNADALRYRIERQIRVAEEV